LLGPYIQPSVFGVLLILSMWAYLRHHILLAALLAAAAPALHPTYLLPTLAMTLVYVLTLVRQDRHIRRGLVIAAVAVLIVLPSAAFAVLRVAAASLDIQAEARRILVEIRQPHHAVPAVWFGWDDGARIALIAAALIVVRRTRIFPVLAVLAAVGTALTAIQILSGSDVLALVFPWRISVVLVPIATTLLLAAAMSGLVSATPNLGADAPRSLLGSQLLWSD
jgi:hypothetical protein